MLTKIPNFILFGEIQINSLENRFSAFKLIHGSIPIPTSTRRMDILTTSIERIVCVVTEDTVGNVHPILKEQKQILTSILY